MFGAPKAEKNKTLFKALKKIEMLKEIIASQNKELIHLRYLTEKSEALARQEKELEKLTETYDGLCREARECKKKYDELNRELAADMNRYKKEMREIMQP